MINPNSQICILNFKLIFHEQNDSKFNISPTLGLRVKNHLQKLPLIKGFLSLPRGCPNFPLNILFYFILFFNEFFFNNQSFLHGKFKHYQTMPMPSIGYKLNIRNH